MKKPAFIITETILSLVLAASLASAAVLTIDIKTNGSILPQEIFGTQTGKKANANHQNEPSKAAIQESSEIREVSAQQSSEAAESKIEESEKQPSEASKENSQKYESSDQTSRTEESSKVEESKPNAAEEQKLQLTEPKDLKTQPKELTKYINDYGYDYDSLGFDHLILVATGEKSTAKIYCYQKSSKGYWWNIAGDGTALTDKGYIGENGADFDIQPDSKKSPLGFYSLGEGFYIGDKPDTTYPLFEITNDTYWVDDTKSKFYNQKVEGTQNKDWSSAEHMISAEKSYKYGLVIDFNTSEPADKKLASAIFMHCGDSPTDGCVVVPENTMKTILEWLDSKSNAYIFITP